MAASALARVNKALCRSRVQLPYLLDQVARDEPAVSLHSVLSPSGADRWSTCLGSLAACKHLPRGTDNPASLLGSAKHAISELVLTNPTMQTIDAMVGQDWYLTKDTKELERTPSLGAYAFHIDDTFADHCKVYIDYVNSRPGTKSYEVFVDASHVYGVDNQGGTIDCKHLDFAAREIEIIDAKFGYIPVGAKHKQLRIYGACALLLHDLEGTWDTVRTTIVQPQDFAEPIKSHVYTRAEIEAFVEEIRPLAQTAHVLYLSPPADLLAYLTPSDSACAWCPLAEVGCAKRNAQMANMFEDISTKAPDIVLMSDAALGELYPQLPGIIEWAQQLTAEAEARALRGTSIPGNKLVYGRLGNRTYLKGSEETIENTLSVALGPDDMYAPRKLKSPTQVEAALKKANAGGIYTSIKPFVTQAPARLKLVPNETEGDPVTVAKVEFQDIT